MSIDLASFLEATIGAVDESIITELKNKPDNQAQQLCHYVGSVIKSLNTTEIDSIVEDLVQTKIKGCAPDAGYAEHCKTEGNEAFAKSKYKEAIIAYAKSLRYVDETNPLHVETAARIYNNRALCFDRLQQPANAIKDANCAIQLDPKFTKAYYRRAIAHRDLKNYTAALKDAAKLLELQQEQSMVTTETEAFIASLEKQLEEQQNPPAKDDATSILSEAFGGLSVGSSGGGVDTSSTTKQAGAQKQQEEEQWTTHAVPWELHQNFNNAEAPSASSCTVDDAAELATALSTFLTVKQTNVAGRELTAASDISSASDVFTEEPFAMMNAKKARLQNCACCLRPLTFTVYSCSHCPMVAFCSPECRAADPFHRPNGPECGLPWPVLLPPDVVLALRFARRLKEAPLDSTPALNLAAALETGIATMVEEDIAHYAALAYVAHDIWSKAVKLHPRQGGGATTLTVGEIFLALCVVRVNAMAIAPSQRSGEEDRLGTAIYPISSMMNHACIANVATRFNGTSMTVRATEDIAAGSALLHCYGPQVGEMTKDQRAMFLGRQYGFQCGCPCCISPPSTEEEMVGLACLDSSCKGVLSVPGTTDAALVSRYPVDAGSGRCTVCGTTITKPDWDLMVEKLTTATEQYKEGCNALAEEQGPKALASLLRCQQARQVLHECNQLRGEAVNALAMAYHIAGKHALAIENCRKSLVVVERHYPAGSSNIAYQQLKLAMLLQGQGEEGKAEAHALMQTAVATIRRHFGAQDVSDYNWI